MSETSALLSALRTAWSNSSEERVEAECRRSPHVEAMIDAVEGALAGRTPLPPALNAVAALKQRLAAVRLNHRKLQADPQLSDGQRAIAERIGRAYADEAALLDEMEAAVRSFERTRVVGVVERLRRVTGELFRCQDAWEAEARETSRIREDAGMVMVGPIYAAVHEACDRVARGLISVDEWMAPLGALQAEVEESIRRLAAGLGQLCGAQGNFGGGYPAFGGIGQGLNGFFG